MQFPTEKTMPTQPQAVTQKYVSNLIYNGRNKEFDIDLVTRRSHFEGKEHVGYYFTVTVTRGEERPGTGQQASGATISQAVRRALEKYGVTFR